MILPAILLGRAIHLVSRSDVRPRPVATRWTLTDIDQASKLAHVLTRLSEGAWDANPCAPMTVTRASSRDRESEILGTLDPNDDDGFVRTLGEWTRLVPYDR